MTLRRRLIAALVCAVSGLLLTGCTISGTVDFVSADEVRVDLLFAGDELSSSGESGCPTLAYFDEIQLTATTDANGAPACRAAGTAKPSELTPFQVAVTDVGEFLVLNAGVTEQHVGWPEGEITLRFPGDVLSTTQGRASGREVAARLFDINLGLRVVALNRPGPPNWVLGLAGGIVIGALAVIGVVLVLRRRRSSIVTAPAEELIADDQLVPEGFGAAPIPDQFYAGPSAEPPRPRPAGPPPTRPPAEPVDHRIWAPPEDH